ncbi:hypothetical protein A2973_02375 [Candidatus Gottesmanbacteria bacterium RIFCSPLOWO2_01_FULL_49_10]|uniref:Phage holin family protein n=1 Tax=Candidatus Gottesmanbacteria bacterium RIFCSPLOWO2_01_FULL_49_10 TaxID=1798396 RepID=A0A1F6AYS3_9BACT|nr:MAG: hypothetical protein A2973_02375 [Candidatus Gottesmanbacteria bacterium RIFCSPLOWO2_01_FULL_49_10]
MKRIVRSFLFHVFALWMTSQLTAGIVILGNWQSLFIAGFILSVLVFLVRPLLSILFIPINILTFGLLSWVVNVIILYLLTLVVTVVEVHPWVFSGISWAGFVIPQAQIGYITSLVIASFLVTGTVQLLTWVNQ